MNLIQNLYKKKSRKKLIKNIEKHLSIIFKKSKIDIHDDSDEYINRTVFEVTIKGEMIITIYIETLFEKNKNPFIDFESGITFETYNVKNLKKVKSYENLFKNITLLYELFLIKK